MFACLYVHLSFIAEFQSLILKNKITSEVYKSINSNLLFV